MEVKIFTEITQELLDVWQLLWNASFHHHFFNSPGWFKVCHKTFNYQDVKIIVTYYQGKPAALLPLVKGKKFGLPVYHNPGGNFSDKCSLVVLENHSDVIDATFRAARSLGSVYISEVSEKYLAAIKLVTPAFYHRLSSGTPWLELAPNPLRHLKSKRKNRIMAVINRYGNELKFEVCTCDLANCLEDAIRIEKDSFKLIQGKSDINDENVISIYRNLISICPDNVILSFLSLGGHRIAYKLGVVIDGYFHSVNTAYVSSFREIYPGKIILYKLTQHLYDQGIRILDMGRGVNNLKQEFTDIILSQYDVAFTPNLLYMAVWKTLNSSRDWLESKPALYEAVRKVKKATLK